MRRTQTHALSLSVSVLLTLTLQDKTRSWHLLQTSSHIEGIMTCFSPLVILWITTFLSLLSAAEILVSGHVGSTAVLPCELQSVDTETPYITWLIDTETVFERWGEEAYQGEGYEGRVDVPEEELRKGNCSLVLKHLKLTDTADYMSYEVVRGTRRLNRLKRSETAELNLISKVHLSVDECSQEKAVTCDSSGNTSLDTHAWYEQYNEECHWTIKDKDGTVICELTPSPNTKVQCTLPEIHLSINCIIPQRVDNCICYKLETKAPYSYRAKPPPTEKNRNITPTPSADPGMKCPHLLVTVLSFISLLIQLF